MPFILIVLILEVISNLISAFKGKIIGFVPAFIFAILALFLFRYLKKRNAETPRMKTRVIEVK